MAGPSLAAKTTVLIVLVLIVGFGASTIVTIQRESALMLDLKGHDVAGAKQVAEVSGELADEGRLYVCARDWAMLEPFVGTKAILVHSAGTPREMAVLESKVQSGEATAVSVHQKLLTPDVVQRLRESARLLMAWPVNDVAKMRELVSWGVNGITTDSLAVVRAMKGG